MCTRVCACMHVGMYVIATNKREYCASHNRRKANTIGKKRFFRSGGLK